MRKTDHHDRIFIQLVVNTVIWAKYPEYINIFNPSVLRRASVS